MPLARVWNGTKVATRVYDGYLDRLSRWSDIQEYMPFLYETARSYGEVRVLELGTRAGNSTLAFLAAAEAAGGHVTSVDTGRVTDDPRGMLPWRNVPGWTFIRGNDMDPGVHAELPAQADVLFVDTSHEYKHTLDELRAYMPRVAPGGVALFHDTNLYMNKAGTEVSALAPWHGETTPPVTQALDEYCKETGLSWENKPGTYGLGVIRA